MKYYIKESQINNIIEVIENIKGVLDSFVEEFIKLKAQQKEA